MKVPPKQPAKKIIQFLKKKNRKARCRHVLAIINNRMQTFTTIREEHWPSYNEFDPVEGQWFVVVEWPDNPDYPHIHVPACSCIFIKD